MMLTNGQAWEAGQMRVIIRLLAVTSLAGATAWFYFQPDWEPGLAVLGALAALMASFVGERSSHVPPAGQRQNVSDRGVGIQAGGNVSVGNIGPHKKDERDV